MKAAGIVTLLLGLVLLVAGVGMFIGSFFVIGASVKSAMESRVVKTIDLTVDQSTTSDPIEVDTKNMCQIVFEADLSGTRVKEDRQGDRVSYHLDYDIPFECEVFDGAGQSIHRESRTLSSSGFRMWSNSAVNEDGGSETVRIMLGTFPAPTSGKLSVTAKASANAEEGIEIESAQVDVLDNVTASGAQAAGGFGMCCGGPAVAMIGLVLLILGAVMGLASRSRP